MRTLDWWMRIINASYVELAVVTRDGKMALVAYFDDDVMEVWLL